MLRFSRLGEHSARKLDDVFRHLMREIDCNLFVSAIQPVVLFEQFKPVCFLASSYRANQCLTGTILSYFPLSISGTWLLPCLCFASSR